MAYPRGYKLYEPRNPSSPNPTLDNLVKVFNEGIDYQAGDLSIVFTELTSNSSYLTGGETEYRYFIPFDDENIGIPSNVFSIINLMPPTNVGVTSPAPDTIIVTFTGATYAQSYKYAIRNLTTDTETYGILPNDGKISGLNSNTSYEIRLSSLNSKGEQTEWTSSSSTKTLKILLLSSHAGNRTISWNWDYAVDATTSRFELVNEINSQILYQGLDLSYSISETPVQKFQVHIRVVDNDGTERITPTITDSVYNDYEDSLSYTQQVYSSIQTLGNFSLLATRNAKDTFSGRNDFYTAGGRTIKVFSSTYTQESLNGAFVFNLFNNRTESYANIFLALTTSGTARSAFRENISHDYAQKINYTPTIFTSESKVLPINLIIRTDFKYTVDSKHNISTGKLSVLTSGNLIYADDKLIVRPQFFISVNRTTQYGLRWGVYNDLSSNVARGRQITYSPINPFGVDDTDIIYNSMITNIEIQSQVNKVRLLCIGDSITAGAPLYDPQYGGTVFMPDLITGKTRTRNVIESEYPYWLQVRLGIDDFEVINEGSGRRTSTEVEYHVEDQMKLYKPEYVIIMIGTNDIFQAQDSGVESLHNVVNTTLNHIRNTINTVIAYGGSPILGTQLPRNSIVPQEAKNALRSLNTGIKNLGIEYAIDIIDWYNEFVQKDVNGVENGVLRYDLTVDDTHPSIEGYKKMAYTINLGIFNSFRANLRLFGNLLGEDVDYSKEEARVQPDPYTLHYTIAFPELRRLQRYVFSKYIKNTGNSWGLFVIQLTDLDDICEIWDEKHLVWTDYLVGQLAPNQIMELRMRYILPATGTTKEVDFNIDYIVKR